MSPNSLFLSSLYVKNFRSLEEAEFAFSPGINLIFGPNARGKTTILEAIYFFITGKSFRTSQAKDLIRHGASFFFLEAHFIKNGLEQSLKIHYDGVQKRIVYNSTVYPSTQALIGLLKGIVFSPDDVNLIKGMPAERRQYLDMQIAQVDPLYVHHLTRFNKAMRQRNFLLKKKQHSDVTLDCFEHEMARSAAYLTKEREKALVDLEKSSREYHEQLTGEKKPFSLIYKGSMLKGKTESNPEQAYLSQLKLSRTKEMIYGSTLYGPHRDDLSIQIDTKEVRTYASVGQVQTCVASLRLAEWERIHLYGEIVPLMLVDDVGVSLDSTRQTLLLKSIGNLGQVFLTSTQDLAVEGKKISTISF